MYVLIKAGDSPSLGDGLISEVDMDAKTDADGIKARLHMRLNVFLQVCDCAVTDRHIID